MRLHFLLKSQQRCVTKEVPRLTTLEMIRCQSLDEDLNKAVDRGKDQAPGYAIVKMRSLTFMWQQVSSKA